MPRLGKQLPFTLYKYIQAVHWNLAEANFFVDCRIIALRMIVVLGVVEVPVGHECLAIEHLNTTAGMWTEA